MNRSHGQNAQSASDESGYTVGQLLRELSRAREQLRLAEAQSADTEAAEEKRVQQKTLLDNLDALILVTDTAHQITYVAGNSMGLLGYAPGELMELQGIQTFLQLFHPQDREPLYAYFKQTRQPDTRADFEVRITDRAGESRWVELSIIPLYGTFGNSLAGYQTVLKDISERKQADRIMQSLNEAAQAVQRASLSLEDVLQVVTSRLQALDLFCVVGLLGENDQPFLWPKAGGDMRRLKALEHLGANMTDMSPYGIPACREALSSGEATFVRVEESIIAQMVTDSAIASQVSQLLGNCSIICAPLRADGHPRGVLVVGGSWLTDQNMPAIQAFANQTAIAIRNAQLVEQLGESEAQYRSIFEAARDGLMILDDKAIIVEASAIACEMFGYTRDEIVGLSAVSLFAIDQDALEKTCRDVIDNGRNVTTQSMATRKHGESFPVELRGSCLSYLGHKHLLALVMDTSERVRAQEALVQAERLSALGQMAGGIAHDFNNILVSILGYAQMATDDLNERPEQLAADLAQIEIGARDAAAAVSRLQSLYRKSDDHSDFVPVQLDEILTEALALNRPRWKDIPQMQGITIHIETVLKRPAPIHGNPSELKRVLTNLIVNAIDAMPDGGTLHLETGEEDGCSYIAVRDTGIGIMPEAQTRIFEPFYTTKKSSGLGLTVCQNIIERHKGVLQVESQPGEGTIFVARFPTRHLERVGGDQKMTLAKAEEPCASSILIVDDEPAVRKILTRFLAREGHRITTAGSGQRAISLLRHNRFDILICDLGMPDISGTAVIQKAHERYPEMPIVLATGWGESITPEKLEQMHVVALLSKPFGHDDVEQVLGQVREAVDEAP